MSAATVLGGYIGIEEVLIKKACSMAMKAHNHKSGKPYILEKSRSSPDAIFSFAGSWSVDDWFAGILSAKQRSILSSFIRSEVSATIKSPSSTGRFYVEKAVAEKKRVVFTGHSSGGPMAILAMLWFLEHCPKPENDQIHPRCVTFGSPLVGDRIFPHALNRENWSCYFIHFVMKYDIVPRISLAPLSSIEKELQPILQFFNPKSPYFGKTMDASDFYVNVMWNASSVASHAACNLMGYTNLLLETVTSFIELSPYRPFGSYVFFTGNGELVVVENPDAVLQLLFYCPQLSSETELAVIANKSLADHLMYENELKECLQMQSVVSLDCLEELPLSSDGSNRALDDLGLSTSARLSLCAAGEWEKQKKRNEDKINGYVKKIEEGLGWLKQYQDKCEARKVGYYDSFKLSNMAEDFQANVKGSS
ncbi:hypothetical protein L1049_027946 [Liquidambar formosana]|uniref:Fungal lipase-type domain-containing protein n=1 Tax=Liquidambar formosana TaxID=63359 RepID=A0AAP0WVQ8_LIQFO